MAANPVSYAEDVLGVHTVYESALRSQALVEQTTANLAELSGKKRFTAEQIADRELDILSDERGKHPEMSQAGMDRHLKEAYHVDPVLKDLRAGLLDLTLKHDSEEYDLRALESELRILVSRMNLLGGYLTYLSTAKLVANAKLLSQQIQQDSKDPE